MTNVTALFAFVVLAELEEELEQGTVSVGIVCHCMACRISGTVSAVLFCHHVACIISGTVSAVIV